MKVREGQLSETLNELNGNFKKSEESKAKLKEQIDNIKKKIKKIPQ